MNGAGDGISGFRPGWDLRERADFHTSCAARLCEAPAPVLRLFRIPAFDEVEATERLLRFGERPVSSYHRCPLRAHRHRCRACLKRGCSAKDTLLCGLVEDGPLPVPDL